MITNRDDDYLICKHYYNNIDKVSAEYPGFITFEHKGNHYFAWVNDGKVILRSEAYPDYERTVRGIKAIIKNRDIHERYSIDSQHGAHFLLLWGGGNHQKHTGNMEKHNEIGRSCPVKNKEELYAMMGFMGDDFVNGVFGAGTVKSGSGKAAAAAVGTAAAASLASTSKKTVKAAAATTTKTTKAAAATASSGGGFKWWYLLPLLLIPLFFMWKGCGDAVAPKAAVKTEVKTPEPAKVEAKTDLAAENDAAAAAAAAEAAKKAAAEREAEEARKAEAAYKAEQARKAKNSNNGINGSTTRNSSRGNKTSGF